MADFSGRTVLVFGAAGALGAGLVGAFRDAGAELVGLDRTTPRQPLDGVTYRAVDVLDDGALDAAFGDVPVPWAVVNAIGGFAAHTPFTELDPATLLGQWQLNATSAALITKHALRRMRERGEGRIVHTASRAALHPEGSGFPYSVSKLAVLQLVQLAAAETHGTQITVNAVVPSIIDTPANRAAMPNASHERWPKVADVAVAYVFLASPEAHLISGAALPVYGRS